jgi:nicotinamide mononucleotide transporter
MTEPSGVLRALSVAEFVGVVLAIAYLWLAIRQSILCWFAAFFSSLIYLWVFYSARLYMESGLQVFYAAMAVYGWYEWKHGGANHRGVRISTWRPLKHVVILALIAALTFAFGSALTRTDAMFPFVDSFTTVSAVFTTYMVARKVLENWLYWLVIDSVSVYLYLARDLYLTAALFVFYLVLVVAGFRRWHRDWKADTAVLESPAWS